MRPESGGRSLRGVAMLCLAGLYLVLALGVTLLGSGVYRWVAAAAEARYTQRTALSYVANQVRRGSDRPAILGEFDGVPALALSETTPDGAVYRTLIYCYDGQLRELYTEEGSGLTPADGIALMALESLDFSAVENLLTVTAGDGENSWSVSLSPRTGLEEVGAL